LETSPISPGAWEKLLSYLTGAGTGWAGWLVAAGAVIKVWLDRKRPESDRRQVDAQTDATHAATHAARQTSDLTTLRDIIAIHHAEFGRFTATIEAQAARIRELELEREANLDDVRLAKEILALERGRATGGRKLLEG